MDKKKLGTQIAQNSKLLVDLYNQVKLAFKDKVKNPLAYDTACDNFSNQYNKLAFPGGLQEGLTGLKNQNPVMIEMAIEFLKADPYYHRSGYNKKIIVHLLKNVTLNHLQIKELQALLINLLKNKQFLYLEYCRLARKIQDQAFAAQIKKIIAESQDQVEINNAKKMLTSMNS